jgi:hypothetical protein
VTFLSVHVVGMSFVLTAVITTPPFPFLPPPPPPPAFRYLYSPSLLRQKRFLGGSAGFIFLVQVKGKKQHGRVIHSDGTALHIDSLVATEVSHLRHRSMRFCTKKCFIHFAN